jgi:hypothetical protein
MSIKKNKEPDTRLSFHSRRNVEESWIVVIGEDSFSFFFYAYLCSESPEDTTSVDVTVTVLITERGPVLVKL